MSKIQEAIKTILEEIGDDPNREGLLETPKRVEKMFNEIFEGLKYSNLDIANMYNKTFSSNLCSLVTVKDIECFSMCEHHLAPMYDMYISIGYIPNGKVLGLSKFARIVELVCKRPQLQEKITADIYEVLNHILNTNTIAIHIRAKHACMTMRGIKKGTAETETLLLKGEFEINGNLQHQFLESLKDK